MVMPISLSEQYSVRKKSAGPQLGSQGYPVKVTLRRMVQFISVRYESALKSERDTAIGFSNLVLGHFHTPNFNLRQREPKLLVFQIVLLSYCQYGPEQFYSRWV